MIILIKIEKNNDNVNNNSEVILIIVSTKITMLNATTLSPLSVQLVNRWLIISDMKSGLRFVYLASCFLFTITIIFRLSNIFIRVIFDLNYNRSTKF